ncbi:MAG: PQQ-binding-like beta-propeller repeat protein [Actinomycetota bacterium]
MSPRRTAAVVALAAMTAGAALVSVAPRLLPRADQLRATGRDAATAPSVAAIEPRWIAPVTGWPSALAADRVGAVVLAGGGEVRAIDPEGVTRWRVDVTGAGFHPPALDRRTVLVGAAARIVALERETGATRWEAPVPDAAAPHPVALADGVALAGSEAGVLVALDAATGETRWSVRYPGSVRSAPVSHLNDSPAAGIVAATWHGGGEPRLRALDLATGAVRWDAPLMGFATAPVAAGGLVVVAEGDGQYAARVVARNAADGMEAWSTSTPASFESGITPGVAGDDVAVVDHFGTLTVLDVTTGAVRARTELDEPVLHTTVVLGGEHVVLTTHQGAVVVVDRGSGRVRYRGSLGGYPAAIARSGPDLLVAVRLRDPGRVESIRLPLH